MEDLTFVDTNILAYAHDPDEEVKYQKAKAVLDELWNTGAGVLSTQVLQEFYSVATTKRKPAMRHADARAVVAAYSEWCSMDTDPLLLISASMIAENHSASWWDALIIEGALRSGATTLLTEDMHNGQRYGRLTVRNPFAEN